MLSGLLSLLLFLASFTEVRPTGLAETKSLTILSVDRDIDISSQIVKESLKYEVENTEKSSVSYFLQSVPTYIADHLSFIAVNFGQNAKYDEIPSPTSLGSATKENIYYKVKFPEPLAPGRKIKFTIDAQYTHVLKPFPSHILQKDQQLVKFEGNIYVNSIYPVKKQTTTIKLSPGSVESHTKYQPMKQETNKLIYGPYENIEANKFNPLSIHYENNSPFVVVNELNRLIEVSHWGNIAVEETLDISHSGAILKGSFSRFEFQRDPRGSDKQPCVKSFRTILPASAKDVYYRDEIGNISTSNLRSRSDMIELEIRPRFPLFGGWKTNYYIGYNVPSYEYMFSSGNKFGLKLRFVDHIYKNYVIDDMTLKIILPEGAKDIEFKAPYAIERLPDEVHYTYLDFTGRPVIVARKKNLVENHIKDFEIQYTFDRMAMIREPLMMVTAFLLLFLVVIIYVRLDFSFVKDPSNETQKKTPAPTTSVEQKAETTHKKSGKKL